MNTGRSGLSRYGFLATGALLAGCLVAPGAAAQTADPTQATETAKGVAGVVDQVRDGDYWTGFFRVPYRLARAPLDWTEDEWGTAALVGLAFLAVVALDEPIQDAVQNGIRNGATDSVADVGNAAGQAVMLASLTGTGLLAGAALDDSRLSATSLVAFQSLVVTAGLTEGIKRLSGRERPNHTDDSYDFNGPGGSSNARSFVSGHASEAFSVATVYATEYDDVWWVPPLAYGTASVIAYSRLNDNKHWASDAVVGVALGYAVGKIAHRLSPFGKSGQDWSVSPMAKDGATGLSFSMKF